LVREPRLGAYARESTPTSRGSAHDQSSCVPAELSSIIKLAPHLAVISPNILEIQSLLAIEPSAHPTQEEVSQAAQVFHDLISAQNTTVPAIIVRAGRLGSYTVSTKWSGWVPPYFTTDEQGRVVDPTGGGNGFLGGLCAGLIISNGDMREGVSHH
jgi:sugar/nucleoside kinase (ribokinase family)